MTWVLSILAATVLSLCLGLILLMRRLGNETLPVTVEWLAELTEDRYRPMARLLDERDFRFLRSQGGFRPEMEKRMRQQRVRVFRGYLRMLDEDFRRVCDGLKQVMVEAECDRPDLASHLILRQASFAWEMMNVRVRVVLFRFGMARVDIAGLVNVFDSMRVELTTMADCVVPVPA